MSRRSTYKPNRAREGDPLTERELEVLGLVAAGETTARISERLARSENTIKSHLTTVYKKTGTRNRVQAVRHYLDHHTAGSPGGASLPADTRPAKTAGHPSLIEKQIAEIEERLDRLTPLVDEAKQLREALDALRTIRAG